MNFKEAQERAQQAANRMKRTMCVVWDESGYSVLTERDAYYTRTQVIQMFDPQPSAWSGAAA